MNAPTGRIKAIPTQARLRALLRYDSETGDLFWLAREAAPRGWNAKYAEKPAFTATNAGGYRTGRIEGVHYYAHRIIWTIENGDIPLGDIDHINGDRSDNRIANLRAVTRSENQRNRVWAKGAKRGSVGVHWRRDIRRWVAIIGVAGKTLNIGCYQSKEDAIQARRVAAEQYGFTDRHGAAQ